MKTCDIICENIPEFQLQKQMIQYFIVKNFLLERTQRSLLRGFFYAICDIRFREPVFIIYNAFNQCDIKQLIQHIAQSSEAERSENMKKGLCRTKGNFSPIRSAMFCALTDVELPDEVFYNQFLCYRINKPSAVMSLSFNITL
jgi:hypothetical protein